MLSAEDAPGMVQIFHICERDKERNLPSTPFLRAWAVRELGAKNRAIRDPVVRPKLPRGKETRAGFQNRDFSDFCTPGVPATSDSKHSTHVVGHDRGFF